MAWCTPIPRDMLAEEERESGRGSEWVVVEENEFFQLLMRKISGIFSFFDSEQWAIAIKNEENWIVSRTKERKQAKDDWEFTLDVYETLSLDPSANEEMLSFLETKFEELPFESSAMREQAQLGDLDADQNEFRKTFNLPKEELVASFVASLGLNAGRIYFSNNFVCFESSLTALALKIPLMKVESIDKDGSLNLRVRIPHRTKSQGTEALTFHILDRNAAYSVFRQLWDLTMESALNRAEAVMKSLEGSHLKRDRMSEADPAARLKKRDRVTRVSSARQLFDEKEKRMFCLLFRLPESERLEDLVSDVRLILDGATYSPRGSLYLSRNVFGFNAMTTKSKFRFVVPFVDIVTLEAYDERPSLINCETATGVEFQLLFASGVMSATKKNLLLELFSKHREIHPLNPYNPQRDPTDATRIKQLYHPLPSDYEEKQAVALDNFEKYWEGHPFGLTLVRDVSLLKLVCGGLPDSRRGEMWQLLSNSTTISRLLPPTYYRDLCESHEGATSTAIEEIEKDIHRSFPTHPYFQAGEEGPEKLRRVLHAYSWHNEIVGYCQSMNIVTALFLVYMPEAEAFSLLQTVVETLMSGYYNRGMVGTMVDVHLFGDLIDTELPEIGAHLRALSVPIPAITMPWLLCLFIGYVPMEISLRVLDAFFCEGLDVLFRVGLGILRLQKEELLATDEAYAVMVMLKRGLNMGEELLDLVFGEYSKISIDDLRERRSQEHKSAAVRLLQSDTRQTKVNDLKMRSSTLLSKDELSELFEYISRLSDDTQLLLTIEQLPPILEKFCPFWEEVLQSPGDWLINSLWDFFTLGRRGSVLTIDALVKGLSVLWKGSVEERWRVCYELSDEENHGITYAGLLQAVDLFVRIFMDTSDLPLEPFVSMIFDKLEATPDSTVSYESVTEEMIRKPLLVEFFGVDLSRARVPRVGE